MPQLFRPQDDTILRYVVVALVLFVIAAAMTGFLLVRSDSMWGVGVAAEQPMPFRHDIHVGGLGLDCRSCHVNVETEAFAGMPSAETCMTCHDQVWGGASVMEPLRASLATGRPLEWTSVHRMPDHVRFHHGAHVAAGVSCATCHGAVEEMAETVKTETMSMAWCLDCHRDPAAKADNPVHDLAQYEADRAGRLVNCSTCHR